MMAALDPEVSALARVKPSTWALVIPCIMWLTGLSIQTKNNTTAIDGKADRQIVEVERKAQIDLLNQQVAAQEKRIQSLEEAQRHQAEVTNESLRQILDVVTEHPSRKK